MNLVLLGPPGSGKSTIAKPILTRRHLTLIATGQRLRDEMAAQTPLGLAVESYMERGELAPDHLMEQLIRASLSKLAPDEGFLMDGYPRTTHQALSLETVLAELRRPLTWVITLEVGDDEVVRRLAGRCICNIPGEAPIPMRLDDEQGIRDCIARGGTITRRDDDEPELIRQRLAVYHEQTAPLIAFYQERNLLLPVDAHGPAGEVVARVESALQST